jgi:hypothetical protein
MPNITTPITTGTTISQQRLNTRKKKKRSLADAMRAMQQANPKWSSPKIKSKPVC